ncbi:alpha/beta hydrolase family protein [Thalassotalea euphylliae]|uniref:alpha/beta hydrolase family protein n=1 Tax=Thalassotalea euphylliae TaxID=1655234 RepID=UPI0036316B67
MKRVFLTAFMFFICIYVDATEPEQLYPVTPAILPELSKRGELNVGVTTLSVVNKRAFDHRTFSGTYERPLTVEVWYPAHHNKEKLAVYNAVTRSHQPFTIQANAYRDAKPVSDNRYPLIVLSHGYTGDRTLMFYLGEHLASHGYIVASIDHTDSTTKEISFKEKPFEGFISTLIHRSRDQQFVLDYFRSLTTPLGDITNTNKAGVIGYSMGGFGAINTVGGCYQVTQQGLIRFGIPEEVAVKILPSFNFCNAGKQNVDSAWKAMIAYAPWGQEHNLHSTEALGSISPATLYITGDLDDISGYEQGVKKLFEQTSKEDNYLLVYNGARHNVAPHPAPSVAYANSDDLGHYHEPSWAQNQLNYFNQHFSLAFLNCYIKENSEGCAMLPKHQQATQTKQADGSMSQAWPGMPDRFATSMHFLSAENKSQ